MLIEFAKGQPVYFVKPGDKIKFVEERYAYTVQAADERFLICTKPFNLRHTVLYTIVDLQKQIRGTENLIFCAGFETRTLCEEALARLAAGETEVSYRNRIPLKIDDGTEYVRN